MFRKFSNKQLSIVLVALLGIYLLGTVFRGSGERTFSKDLSRIDTTKVSKLIIDPGRQEGTVTLEKEAGNWMVNLADGSRAVVPEADMDNALSALSSLEANQLISRSSEKHTEFKVDETGTRVQVMEGDKKTLDIIFGRFEYKQSGMMSYVRLQDKDEIYLVNGYLDASFNKAADDWRNKTIVKGERTDWISLSFLYPADSSFRIVNEGGIWKLDSLILDPSKVDSYLGTLTNLQGSQFAAGLPANYDHKLELRIETANSGFIQVDAYSHPEYQYVISSTQNPGAYFQGNAGDLWKRVFIGKEKLIPGQ